MPYDRIALAGAAALAAVLILWAIGATRRLRALSAQLRTAYAEVDRWYLQRETLAEQVCTCASGPIGHERETLIALQRATRAHRRAGAGARSQPGAPETTAKMAAADLRLLAALARLLALTEAYPDLKRDPRMIRAVAELGTLGPQLISARQAYNSAAAAHNAALRLWPARAAALALRMRPAGLLPDENAKPALTLG